MKRCPNCGIGELRLSRLRRKNALRIQCTRCSWFEDIMLDAAKPALVERLMEEVEPLGTKVD